MSSDVGWLGMAPQSCARCVQHIVTELCGVRASSEGRTSNICSRIVQKPCLIPTQQHTQHAHRRSDKYSPCRPAHKGDTSRDTQQCETHTNHDEYNSPLLLAVEPVLRDCTAVRTCEGCTVQVGPVQPSHRFHDKLGREIRLAQSTAHHGAFGISGREHRAHRQCVTVVELESTLDVTQGTEHTALPHMCPPQLRCAAPRVSWVGCHHSVLSWHELSTEAGAHTAQIIPRRRRLGWMELTMRLWQSTAAPAAAQRW